MTVHQKILELLANNSIEYKLIEHEPVYTSEQAAQIRDSDISMGAKALVFYADKQPIILVVPGDQKANLSKVKKNLHIKDLRMATREQVEQLTTLKPGSIPPVGKAMGIKSYYDTSFSSKDKVAFNAGSLTISVIMNAKDLIELENPTLADLT